MANVPLNFGGKIPTSGRDIEDTTSKVVTDTVNRGSYVSSIPLLSLDKTTTGAGTPVQKISGYNVVRVEVWGTGTYTVQLQVEFASGTYRALPVWDMTKQEFVEGNNITKAGLYEVDIKGFKSIRANVTSISGGNVNASGVVIA
ncbi:hypothetical protein P8864_10330 [Priestia flexa]|uniref:hypothetical protein n=1 Tax=Priestia flexa TaxID=86664 RepID=UPI000C238BC6|nr:hypothetical protein [Priestia flexa]MEC0666285.1 hypothetical protein [Priestia flexa]